MRRKDRMIEDLSELKSIVKNADVCRLAFAVRQTPYIVTMNFGYSWSENLILYFHCANEGKKLEMMKQNNLVCFEMDIDHELKKGTAPCDWSMKYKSIVGYGLLEIIEDTGERKAGLDLIMDKYGYIGDKAYNEKLLEHTEILRLTVTELSGKKRS